MKYLNSFISKRPSCPSEKERLALAIHFFPLRAKLKVTVCDFSRKDSADPAKPYNKFDIPLGQVEDCK